MEISNGYELLKVQTSQKRIHLEQLNAVIFPCNGPKPQTLIELRNEYDCMHLLLLYEMITNCVIPQEYGGRGGHVVYIDNEHQFDPKILLGFFESHLDKYEIVNDRDKILQNGLNALTVLSCYTSLEFTIALLEDVEELLLANENIALVIIDGIDAFYWEDGEDSEQTSRVMHFKENVIKLRRICDAHKVNIMFTVETNYNKDLILYDSQNSAGNSSVQIDYKLELRRDVENNNKLLLNEREIIFDNNYLTLVTQLI